MKKIIIGMVAVVIIIGLGYLFTFYKKSSGDKIYLFVESGKVFTKENKDANYIVVPEKKISVVTGSYIKTEVGFAHVLFPNNSMISISENSEIEVKYTKQNVSVSQFFGDTYSRVEKLASGNSYEVKTDSTLAAVRGTKFAIRYDAKTKIAKVAVTESKVKVSRVDATSTEPLEVLTGEVANVDEKINPVMVKSLIKISSLKDDVTLKEWIERNALLDKYIENDAKTFLEKLIKTEENGSGMDSLRNRLEKIKGDVSKVGDQLSVIKKTSMGALLAMGGSQKCNYSYNSNGVVSSVVIYLGKGKMRVDSNTKTGGENIESHMTMIDKISYVWGDGMPQGIKMAIPEMTQNQTSIPASAKAFDFSKEMDYSCEVWSYDNSVFELPSNIKFIDMSEMMKGVMQNIGNQTGTNPYGGAKSQCGACSSLEEPALTQCKKAFGCN